MPAIIRHLTATGLIDPGLTADSLAGAARHEPADGVYTIANTFETFKTLRLDAHLDRLQDSARRAGVTLTLDRGALRSALRAMIAEAGYGDVRFKITASNAVPNTLLLAIEPFKPLAASIYADGVKVVSALGAARHDPAAKTSAWMHDRKAIEDALPPGTFTALLLDGDGVILEGISSNFYAVLDGELRTASAGMLPGIAQQVVFAVAPEVIAIRRKAITLADVPRCTDAFITSASRGIVPVVAIDAMTIADGAPGAVTRALRRHYAAYVAAHLEEL